MIFLKINPAFKKNSELTTEKSILDSYFDKWNHSSFPLIDIFEDEKKIYLRAEIPGIKKEDIKIVAEKDNLILFGNKNFDYDRDKIHRSENFYGSFKRSFKLSGEIDRNSIAAKLEDGVLIVTFDKLNLPKEKIIEVN